MVSQFRGPVHYIARHGDGAGFEDTVEAGDEFRGVLQIVGDPVAGADAQVEEGGGKAGGLVVQLVVGYRCGAAIRGIRVNQGGPLRVAVGGFLQETV